VVLGTGYVGLVTGVCLAELGHHVVAVDVDVEKVAVLNSGKSPIYEPGLDALLDKNVSVGRFVATSDLEIAVIGADISIIAVGTPTREGHIDLSSIRDVSTQLASVLHQCSDFHVVCVKSTVLPGTTENVVGTILAHASTRQLGIDLGLCMNPEFLAEGTAVQDFMNPDRIVIGATDQKTFDLVSDMYSILGRVDFVNTSPVTAEISKYAANSFLATTISFSNEIANLCSVVGDVDVVDVMAAVRLDRRLTPLLPEGRIWPGLMSFLHPGVGFGGSCFPKDIRALVAFGSDIKSPMPILQAVLETNDNQWLLTVKMLTEELGELRGKKIGVLGLAFKPGTSDIRMSPSINILRELWASGANLIAHDPVAISNMKLELDGLPIEYSETFNDFIFDCDAIVLVTAWPEYKELENLICDRNIVVVDGRRFLDKDCFARYRGIGI